MLTWEILAWGVFSVIFFFSFRLLPILPNRNRGCDAYYFLLTSEVFRNTKKLPITTPLIYTLELEEQWYPPLFSIFLGFVNEQWLRKYHWLLNHLLDFCVYIGIFFFLYNEYGFYQACAGAIAYTIMPFIILEFSNLTSRSLANLIFLGYMISTFFWVEGIVYGLLSSIVFGTLLLYCHKLTIQLLWFLIPFIAIFDRDFNWLLPIILSYGLAFFIGRGHFINILRAHWDIVSFWHRNWRWLGMDPVKNSPIYGKPDTGSGYHQKGFLKVSLMSLRRMFQYNPWILCLFPWFIGLQNIELSSLDYILLYWIFGCYIWAGLTFWVPNLRSLGEGSKYIKYIIPPTLFLSFGSFFDLDNFAFLVALIVTIGIVMIMLFLVFREIMNSRQQTGLISDELLKVIDHVKGLNDPHVMCLPYHICDLLAFHTRKKVLWGTHGFGFKNIEPIFPLLRISLEEVKQRYKLTHLIVDEERYDLNELGVQNSLCELKSGKYILLKLPHCN